MAEFLGKYSFFAIFAAKELYDETPSEIGKSVALLKNRMGPIGFGELWVNTIIDTTLYATKDFDVDALHKAIQPLFKDKSIKRHEIHCVHDSTFDVHTIDNSTPFIEGFIRVEQSVRRRGDNHLTLEGDGKRQENVLQV